VRCAGGFAEDLGIRVWLSTSGVQLHRKFPETSFLHARRFSYRLAVGPVWFHDLSPPTRREACQRSFLTQMVEGSFPMGLPFGRLPTRPPVHLLAFVKLGASGSFSGPAQAAALTFDYCRTPSAEIFIPLPLSESSAGVFWGGFIFKIASPAGNFFRLSRQFSVPLLFPRG